MTLFIDTFTTLLAKPYRFSLGLSQVRTNGNVFVSLVARAFTPCRRCSYS